MKSNRIIQFDLTRALCALWIVGFWHLQYYVPYAFRPQGCVEEVCRTLTNGVLATFTFFSGFFLKKYVFRNLADVGQFYKKRLLRFYPLYAVAVVLMVVICGGTTMQLVSSLLGYAVFTSAPLQTLWYINMLIVFYAITPLLPRWHSDDEQSSRKMQLICWGITAVFCVAAWLLADSRVLLFFPFYLLALNTDMDMIRRFSPWGTIVAAVVLLTILFAFVPQHEAIRFVEAALVVYVLLNASVHAKAERAARLIDFAATASMCAYLFHRQLYALVLMAERTLRHRQFMSLPVAMLTVIVLFALSYGIQCGYDWLVKKL